jgi:DNA gyrase subunit A
LIENILKYNFLFSPVEEKIKNRKSENVYSIRVANECHSFVANGFVNHNTECRMMSLAEQMFEDIEKETVEFVPNYDNNLKEPKVLPTKFPQLLLNGTTGIAVGMATNIPPHNLSECMDAAIFLADNPDCNTDDLMQFIKGPDFPTGGTIYG